MNGGQKILKDVAYMLELNAKISHATTRIETNYCDDHDHTLLTHDEHNQAHIH